MHRNQEKSLSLNQNIPSVLDTQTSEFLKKFSFHNMQKDLKSEKELHG